MAPAPKLVEEPVGDARYDSDEDASADEACGNIKHSDRLTDPAVLDRQLAQSRHDASWNDWVAEDADDAMAASRPVCLFCTRDAASCAAVVAHMRLEHSFDLVGLVDSLRERLASSTPAPAAEELDAQLDYARIRLVNLLRADPTKRTLKDAESSGVLGERDSRCDALLCPVLTDDAMLYDYDHDEVLRDLAQ